MISDWRSSTEREIDKERKREEDREIERKEKREIEIERGEAMYKQF